MRSTAIFIACVLLAMTAAHPRAALPTCPPPPLGPQIQVATSCEPVFQYKDSIRVYDVGRDIQYDLRNPVAILALNCPVHEDYTESFTRTWSKVTDEGENIVLFSALDFVEPDNESSGNFYDRFPESKEIVGYGSEANITPHSLLFNANVTGRREIEGLSQVFGTWNCTVSNRYGRDSVLTTLTLTNKLGPCNEDDFRCPDGEYGRCIPNHYLCDLKNDCPGGFDEQNCSTVEFTSPLVRSVEEGAVDEIEFCLTVTEARQSHIFREYYINPFSGSAIDKLDYVFNNNTVVFNGSYSVGDSECVSVNVSALSDNLVEGTEAFEVSVHLLDTTVTIFIIDNDYLRIGFEGMSYSVTESAGVLEIPLRLFGGNTPDIVLPLGVRVTSRDGSAVAVDDYDHILTTLHFQPDRSVPMSVRVNILNDTLPEEEERFTVELTAFDLSVVLVNSITEVVIEDDDDDEVDFCTVELVGSIEVTGNTATFEFRGVGSGITRFICKLNGCFLPDCSSPLTGLRAGLNRLRVVPVGCNQTKGVTFRFYV